jgi:hypothetical protein
MALLVPIEKYDDIPVTVMRLAFLASKRRVGSGTNFHAKVAESSGSAVDLELDTTTW